MVFAKFFVGLGAGMTIPFMVHDNVYYAIASCFFSPHLKFREQQRKIHANYAYDIKHLDNYFKDIAKSFLFFWLIIGPTLYITYYKKENILELAEDYKAGMGSGFGTKENPALLHDNFSDILMRIKTAEA